VGRAKAHPRGALRVTERKGALIAQRLRLDPQVADHAVSMTKIPVTDALATHVLPTIVPNAGTVTVVHVPRALPDPTFVRVAATVDRRVRVAKALLVSAHEVTSDLTVMTEIVDHAAPARELAVPRTRTETHRGRHVTKNLIGVPLIGVPVRRLAVAAARRLIDHVSLRTLEARVERLAN